LEYRSNPDSILVPYITDIESGAKLGGGNFGEFLQGNWNGGKVALKRPIGAGSQEILEDFKKEGRFLRQLKHPNIVSYFGIFEWKTNLYIVTEQLNDTVRSLLIREKEKITGFQLLTIAINTAAGMTYLAQNNKIHRDLAASNLLVSTPNKSQGLPELTVKVTDFGLARQSREFPGKWTAPEAFTGEFSLMSDVWSFGIVLHEIFTYGEEPYSQLSTEQLIEKVRGNKPYLMNKPINCPSEVYAVMQDCWSPCQDRPTFEKVLGDLQGYEKTLRADPNNNRVITVK